MNITLRQIEVFLYTANLGSLTQAARKLAITQSATSMALKEFETQMGEKLFDRSGRKLILNENGRSLIAGAAGIIGRATELESFFRSDKGLPGTLKVGASSTIGNYVLPQRVADFIDRNPLSRIHLEVGNTEEIVGKVNRFQVDVGFIEGICETPEIELIPWLDDELAVFAATAHPLSRKADVTPKALMNCNWILREQGSGTREIFERCARPFLGRIRILLELGHTEAIKNAVAGGNGISCLSKRVLAKLLELGQIRIIPTPFLDLSRKFFIIIHRDKYRSRLLQGFLENCRVS